MPRRRQQLPDPNFHNRIRCIPLEAVRLGAMCLMCSSLAHNAGTLPALRTYMYASFIRFWYKFQNYLHVKKGVVLEPLQCLQKAMTRTVFA